MLTDMQIPIVPVSDGTTQRLIANIQENTVANKDYYTGEQFILNGVLYKVTKITSTAGSPAIAQGATIDIANDCVVSDTITQQIKDYIIRDYVEITAAEGTYSPYQGMTDVAQVDVSKVGYTALGVIGTYGTGASNTYFTPTRVVVDVPNQLVSMYGINVSNAYTATVTRFYVYILYVKNV